tara:strand:- start:384 stop:557 length:174 start_codon:yes stop_codon:yes gene_type:complete
MNTIAHIAALPAVLWMSLFCFETLAIAPLGVAMLVVFMFLIPKTFLAIHEDMTRWRG